MASKAIVKTQQDDDMFDSIFSMAMMMVFMMVLLPTLPVVQNINNYVRSQMYSGNTVSELVEATEAKQKKSYTPNLSWVYLTNLGVYNAIIAINEGTAGYESFEICPGETIAISRLGAMSRISTLSLSSPHNTVVRVIGEY